MAEKGFSSSQINTSPTNGITEKRVILTRMQVTYFVFYVCILLFPLVTRRIFPASPDQLFPPFHVLVLWAFPLGIMSLIRNRFCHLISIVWTVWFLIGSLNLLAAYDYYGDYYLLNAKPAAIIYIIYTFVFTCGLFLIERIISLMQAIFPRPTLINSFQKIKNINSLFAIFLLAFPFAWFADLYLSLGYVPILSALGGRNISPDLYELNYGRLYGFGLLIVVSMLFVLDKARRKPYHKQWIYWILLVLFSFFAMSAGKRYWIVVFLIAVLVYLLKTTRINTIRLFLFASVVIGLYMGLLIIRQGVNTQTYRSLSAKLVTTGNEYLIFAYAVNHFYPGGMENYNWLASAFGSLLNSKLLALLGYDKNTLVTMGSAYAWMSQFGATTGVRTGLVSELYMAYGYWGTVIFFFFGIFSSILAYSYTKLRSVIGHIYMSVVFGLCIIAIVGQTTDFIGGMVILFYSFVLYLATWVFLRLSRRSAFHRATVSVEKRSS